MEKLRIIFYFIKFRWFSRFRSVSGLQKHQHTLYKKQLAFLRRSSQFYRNTPGLPIIDKNMFMDCFNHLNTVGIDRDRAISFAIACERKRDFSKKLGGITVGLSSGTSGHRGVFLVSDRERAIWAGAILARTLPKWHLFGVRVAFFMRADSALYETVQSRAIQFRFFDMLGDMDRHFQQLEQFSPTLLVAPPSCLLAIAKWNKSSQIRPQKVISIAEVLEDADAQTIKSALGVSVVHQIYQCTEGFLGATCEHGVLHLNEDFLRIEKEWLDENRFVPIITDLMRRAQPIVRYRLNDILVAKKEPCPCGSPLMGLDKVEGRQDDIFEFEGENGLVDVFPDFIRRCILFAEGVGEYCVKQISPKEIVVLADNLSSETKLQITSEFEKLAQHFCFKAPSVVFEPYEYNCMRKLKRVEKIC